MNTSHDSNTTPIPIFNRNKFIESSSIDCSTSTSPISNRWENLYDANITPNKINNSTVMFDNKNVTMIEQFLKQIREHSVHFDTMQNQINVLDNHLCEIAVLLNQLQTLLDRQSPLRTITDRLETRLIQIAVKQEQIRTGTTNFYESSTKNETPGDTHQCILPSASSPIKLTNPAIYYSELLDAAIIHMKHRSNLIQHLHRVQQRINERYSNSRQRHGFLLLLVEKLIAQQKSNIIYPNTTTMDKSQYDHHEKQFIEFNQLNGEYRLLQDENRLLKEKLKENIDKLHYFINKSFR